MKKKFIIMLVVITFSFLPSIGICDPMTFNFQGTITKVEGLGQNFTVGDQFTAQLFYNYDETLVVPFFAPFLPFQTQIPDMEQLNNNSTYSIDFGHTTMEGEFDYLYHFDDSIEFFVMNDEDSSGFWNEDLTIKFNTSSGGPFVMMPDPTSLTSASSIDFYVGSGQGGHTLVNGDLQVVAEPVPEPATILLFGIGIVSIIGLRHRSKK